MKDIQVGDRVRIVDNLSSGKSENIQGQYQGNDNKFSQRAQSV